jgi:hypothetical protein
VPTRRRAVHCLTHDPNANGRSSLQLGQVRSASPAVHISLGVIERRCLEPFTGEIVADHVLVAPGETSIVDEHYGSSWPDKPAEHRGRKPRRRSHLCWAVLNDLGHHPLCMRLCVQTAGFGRALEVTTGRHRPEICAQPRTGEHWETLKETGLA